MGSMAKISEKVLIHTGLQTNRLQYIGKGIDVNTKKKNIKLFRLIFCSRIGHKTCDLF